MTHEKSKIRDAWAELFGLSKATTTHGEESPGEKDHRLTKEIQDSEQRLQRWREKRAFVLRETSFHKRLKAVENFLRIQELSPLLKGYQPGGLNEDDKKRIRCMSAPEGELRIAFEDEPISPRFRKMPQNLASSLYFVDRPDPSHIYLLEIYEHERYAVSQLEKVEWKIIREEKTLSDLKRERGDNRIKARVADIPLPGEPQETVSAEATERSSENERERKADHLGDRTTGRGPYDENISAPATTNESEDLEREKTAKTEPKEFDPRDLNKGKRGKLIGIALSGSRSGIAVRRIAAGMDKTKVPCPSDRYSTFKDWYRGNPQSFYNFLSRLRKEGYEWEKAKSQRIPDNYYESYQ